MKKEIKEKIDQRTFCIGIAGLGYVGLPLSLNSVARGFPTIGFDIDKSKVEMLLEGKTYLKHLSDEAVVTMNKTGKFVPTSDFSEIKRVDAVLICVPTPLTEQKKPDLSYVEHAAVLTGQNMKKGSVVVLESTVYPGVTEEILIPILEKESGMKCGRDFKVGYSPERINPGDQEHTIEIL